MTPMIDVVFLLLVFFLWTSSFEKPEFQLPLALADLPSTAGESSTDTPPIEAFDELIVHIAWQNEAAVIRCNQESIASPDALMQRLRQIIAIGVLPPVIIDPAPEVPMGDAIEIYDIARLAGFDRVLFAAHPADAGEPAGGS